MTHNLMYMLDKCMPFGASISCKIFQDFSDSLKFIIEQKPGIPKHITNYLDDFLFIALSMMRCNYIMREFLLMLDQKGCPYAPEKTEWAAPQIIFLGILLNGILHILIVPERKRQKALNVLEWIISKKSVTVKVIQKLTGVLNFLNKVIVPGRTFTRRMYSKLALKDKDGKELKAFHHVSLNSEFKCDCLMLKIFLMSPHWRTMCRPFIDMSAEYGKWTTLKLFIDSSACEQKEFGCVYGDQWTFSMWNPDFIREKKPSIQYLELYALCVAIFTWENEDRLKNARIRIFCDNKSVKSMVNNMTSGCKNCLHLIRLLVLNNLRFNR